MPLGPRLHGKMTRRRSMGVTGDGSRTRAARAGARKRARTILFQLLEEILADLLHPGPAVQLDYLRLPWLCLDCP